MLTKLNNPKLGARVAERDFKSSKNSKKAAIPTRLKFKASWVIWVNEILDGANPNSDHPLNALALGDVEGSTVFGIKYTTAKNRTGTEGRTQGNLTFVSGEFDPIVSMIADAKDFNVLEKSGGNYPTKDNPHIFQGQSDCEYENNLMKSKGSINAYTVKGYDRPTNVLEARAILKYNGTNETLNNAQSELYGAIMNGLENKLKYELETNCVTDSEIQNNRTQINKMFSFMSKIKRAQKIDRTEKIEMPDKIDIDVLAEERPGENEQID